jgi:hypothetical protein
MAAAAGTGTVAVSGVKYQFEANYASDCAFDCGERIAAGDDIVKIDEDEFAHSGCAENDGITVREWEDR